MDTTRRENSDPWADDAVSRRPRKTETREVEARPKVWKQASALPDPDPKPGWVFRYIRVASRGENDLENLSAARREGWEPCSAEDHPELMMDMAFNDSMFSNKGMVEIGGLVLCRMPEELAQSRVDQFTEKNQRQIASVDAKFLAEKPHATGMRTFAERTSRVSRGSSNIDG